MPIILSPNVFTYSRLPNEDGMSQEKLVPARFSVSKLFPAGKCVNLTESMGLSDKSSVLKLFS
jgi:hypothetical protein